MQPSPEQIITLNAKHFYRTRDTDSYELNDIYFHLITDLHKESHILEKKLPMVINDFNTNSNAMYYEV